MVTAIDKWGLDNMGVTLSAEDRQRLRTLPAYRRAIWSMRLTLAGFPALLLVGVSAGLGVPKQIGLPIAAAVIAMAFAGILLCWSVTLNLNRFSRRLGEQYRLNMYEISAMVRSDFLRDLLWLGGKG